MVSPLPTQETIRDYTIRIYIFLDSDLSRTVVPTSSRHVITNGLTKGLDMKANTLRICVDLYLRKKRHSILYKAEYSTVLICFHDAAKALIGRI